MKRIREIGASPWRRFHADPLWALLLPLAFLMRPYSGIVQDARIYIGRGLADLDPGGLGQDIMFVNDGQTGFSLFRPIIRLLLGVLPADQTSTLLVCAGLVMWLIAAAALMRRIASDRAAWAATMATLALSSDYGGFGVFRYAEAIATPRIFAEAAVLGALAMLLDGRRLLAWILLGLALSLHPLMALPGVALAVVLLVTADRRWLYPIGAAVTVLLAGAWFRAPVVGRLFVVMDPVWLSLIRHRSLNLFPTLWSAQDDARILCQAAAAIVAGRLAAPPARTLFWGIVAVAAVSLLIALAFGDAIPSVLIMQLQLWRALWLLTLLGNAGLALAAVRLWRAEPALRVTLALLVMAWSAQSSPLLAALLASAAVALLLIGGNGRLSDISPRIGRWALGAALASAAAETVGQSVVLLRTILPLGASVWHLGPWTYVTTSGVLALPIMAATVTTVLVLENAERSSTSGRSLRAASLAALVCLSLVTVLFWDSRTDENRLATTRLGASDPLRFFDTSPGAILWIDEASESWFMLGRPAFVNAQQGSPILFSRDLAVEWADRARFLIGLGLLRGTTLTPWASEDNETAEIRLTPTHVAELCNARRHPAGLVVPGSQLDAVPPGLPAQLWISPTPFHRVTNGAEGLHWSPVPVFTLVQCATPAVEPRRATSKVGED